MAEDFGSFQKTYAMIKPDVMRKDVLDNGVFIVFIENPA